MFCSVVKRELFETSSTNVSLAQQREKVTKSPQLELKLIFRCCVLLIFKVVSYYWCCCVVCVLLFFSV